MYRLISFIFISLCFTQQGKGGGAAPLPRFASLRSHKVNVHVGPGSDFPVEWMFQRQGLPIEIIAEFDTWRQIRDSEGTSGWVHKSLLIGKRNALILTAKTSLKSTATSEAVIIAYLEAGVIAKIKQCKADWCRIEVKGYDGWVERKHLWGCYTHEEKF